MQVVGDGLSVPAGLWRGRPQAQAPPSAVGGGAPRGWPERPSPGSTVLGLQRVPGGHCKVHQ